MKRKWLSDNENKHLSEGQKQELDKYEARARDSNIRWNERIVVLASVDWIGEIDTDQRLKLGSKCRIGVNAWDTDGWCNNEAWAMKQR